MTRLGRVLLPALLALILLVTLLPAVTSGAEEEYPAGVLAAKECTVEVMAWVDGRVSGAGRSFDATGPFSLGSGFFANENGDVFTAAHCVNLSEEELADAAVMYYLGGLWFEDELYEEMDFGSFYDYNYGWVWELWLNDRLSITTEEVDYVYRYGDDEPYPVQDILFYKQPESGQDIAILETGLSDTPYMPLQAATPEEGSRAYIVGYAGIDLLLEFWQAMDDIMADPQQRPGTFAELMRQAEAEMVAGLKREGPSVETGLLGTSTRIYGMDARRFHGTALGGFSGGPVVTEMGNCVGLLPWGQEGARGYFIPAEHLDEASLQANIDTFPALKIESARFEPAFVDGGQGFELVAEVSNLGFFRGYYTALLTLDDGTQAEAELDVDYGATETLVIAGFKQSSGLSYGSLQIGAANLPVTINPVALSELTVKPLVAEPGENVAVQVRAENVSAEASTLPLTLSLDGVEVSTQSLSLEPGASQTVTFLVNQEAEGGYQVAVGNLSGEFTVEAPATDSLFYILIGAVGLMAFISLIIGIVVLMWMRG